MTTLKALTLALRLLHADATHVPGTYAGAEAERICSDHWEADSDAWWSCSVLLQTWTCEITGGCAAQRPEDSTLRAMPLPDPAWAGSQDVD